MKPLLVAILVTGAFAGGWLLSRSATLREYPPGAVKQIADAQELIGEMSKEDQKALIVKMNAQMASISQEFDYQALYEGMSAGYFGRALEADGVDGVRKLVEKQTQKFIAEYENGLDLPEDAMKLATALYDHSKRKD